MFFRLLQLPEPCLVAVLRCLVQDPRSLFSAAQAHSRLRQAAVLVGSIRAVLRHRMHLDSLVLHLTNHGQHIHSLELQMPLDGDGQEGLAAALAAALLHAGASVTVPYDKQEMHVLLLAVQEQPHDMTLMQTLLDHNTWDVATLTAAVKHGWSMGQSDTGPLTLLLIRLSQLGTTQPLMGQLQGTCKIYCDAISKQHTEITMLRKRLAEVVDGEEDPLKKRQRQA
jgi:hypothetical protein